MKARFELRRTTNLMFNPIAANQEIIPTSGVYASKRNTEVGIASEMKNAIVDARYEEKVDTAGRPYFVLSRRQQVGDRQE